MKSEKLKLPKYSKKQDPFHFYLRRVIKFNIRKSDKTYSRKLKHHRKDIYL